MNYNTYTVRVYEDGSKCWRNEKGELHNEYGPAVEWASGRKDYWLNGREYSYEAWKREVEKLNKPKVKELTISQINQLLGYDVKIVKE